MPAVVAKVELKEWSAGLNNRLDAWKIAPNALTVAENVVLRDGRLQPLKGLGSSVQAVASGTKAIWKLGNNWITSTSRRWHVPWQTSYLIHMESGGACQLTDGTTTETLGLARPTVALTATNAAAGNITADNITWVYTWTSALGQESGPSPPSNELDLSGRSVSFSALGTPPAGATGWKLYRSLAGVYLLQQTGTVTGGVASAPANDNTLNLSLGTPILTEDASPPPNFSGLAQGTYLGKVGAFLNNKFYQSNAGAPWAWPTAPIELPSNIVAAFGSSVGWVVLTADRPYFISGEDLSTRKDEAPNVYGCAAAHSMTKTHGGWIWWADEGLVMWREGSGFELLSAGALDDEDVAAYSTTDMVGAFTNGELVLFHTGGALRCDLRSGTPVFTTSTVTTAGAHVTTDGTLYVVDGTAIKQWAAGSNLTMRCRTKEFCADSTRDRLHVHGAQVRHDGTVTAKWYASGTQHGGDLTLTSGAGDTYCRIKPGAWHRIALELSSSEPIYEVTINPEAG
jgi:hypothetical protein